MKKQIYIKFIAFIAIFACIFSRLSSVLLPDWFIETQKYNTLYQTQKDSIDILFLGNSHQYYSIYPLELYRNYKLRSFNLGSPEQSMMQSYYFLLEAYKYQKIKYCFIDVGSLFYSQDHVTEFVQNQRYKAIPYMKFSINKCNLLAEYTSTPKELLEALVPLYKFHDRWNTLSKGDFSSKYKIYPDYTYGGLYSSKVMAYKGYSKIIEPSSIIVTEKYKEINDIYDISEIPPPPIHWMKPRRCTLTKYINSVLNTILN